MIKEKGQPITTVDRERSSWLGCQDHCACLRLWFVHTCFVSRHRWPWTVPSGVLWGRFLATPTCWEARLTSAATNRSESHVTTPCPGHWTERTAGRLLIRTMWWSMDHWSPLQPGSLRVMRNEMNETMCFGKGGI